MRETEGTVRDLSSLSVERGCQLKSKPTPLLISVGLLFNRNLVVLVS